MGAVNARLWDEALEGQGGRGSREGFGDGSSRAHSVPAGSKVRKESSGAFLLLGVLRRWGEVLVLLYSAPVGL